MAGWGTGSFENEDAQAFLAQLHSKGLDDLRKIFAQAFQSEYLEARESSVVVAAAEVIAALKGKPPQPLPREVEEWLSKAADAATPDLNDLARRAVNRVRFDSELKDLWLQAEGLNEWSVGLRDLEQRLAE